jgi:hypothetical protein
MAVVAILAATGCQPTASGGLPILTDPGEIVMAGARSTAALQTVHARIDMTLQVVGGQLGGQQVGLRSTTDIDIDLARHNLAGRSVTTGQGGPDQATEIIFVDGQQFTRDLPATRWTRLPNFGPQQPLPTNDELVAAISAVIESAGVVLQLADSEPCGEASCYHVIAELDATSTWHLIGPVLMGAPANGPPPPGFELPPITLHVFVDQASRALAGANLAVSFQGTSVALTVNLTNHNAPFQIVPPNPALVDQLDVDFGGGIIRQLPVESP